MADRITVIIDGDASRFVSESRRAGMAASALGRTVNSQTRASATFNSVLNAQRRNLQALTTVARRAALVGVGVFTAGVVASVKASMDFEQAFSEVRKTVEGSERDFQRIERGLRNLAREIPISVDELARLAGQAGALGVASEDIVKFTETAANLGVATDLSADEAATALARLANILDEQGRGAVERMGATLVDLGNKGASTEREITEMSLRIARGAATIGLSAREVLGLSASLANIGIRAEAGGTAVSRALLQMNEAVKGGGKELRTFAEVSGMTVEEFKRRFEEDAPGALGAFAEGLAKLDADGKPLLSTLKDVELNEIRVRDALLGLGTSAEGVGKAQKVANEAWRENTALTEEARKRYKTAESQLAILKNTARDAAISLGDELIKEAQKFMPGIQRAAEEISEIFRRQDIGFEEKFELSIRAAERGLRPLAQAIDRLNLDQKLVEVFSDAIPAVAEAMGKGGLKVAEAFATGFVESNAWGKIVLGAILIQRMGLGPLFWRTQGTVAATSFASALGSVATAQAATAGASAGTAFGRSFQTTSSGLAIPTSAGSAAAAGAATGGLRGRLGGLARGLGRGLGIGAGISGLVGFAADPGGRGIGGRLENALSAASFGLLPSVGEQQAEKFEEMRKAIEGAGGELDELRSITEKWIPMMVEFGELTEDQAEELTEFATTAERAAMRVQREHQARLTLRQVEHEWSRSLRKMAGISEKELEKIEHLMNKHPRKGQQALARAMRDGVKSIREAMADGEVETRQGLVAIHRLLNKELQLKYGIAHGDAEKILKAKKENPKTPGHSGLARGGEVTRIPGAGVHDTVPLAVNGAMRAMVAPGEDLIVANRHQRPLLDMAVANTFGVGGLQGFFSAFNRPHFMARGGVLPRLAQGGLQFALGPYSIPPIQYDPNHAGGNSHWHITGTTPAWTVAIGRQLQRMNFQVAEHPAFGGVTARHSATGGHYDARAIDVNSAADETRAETARVAALLRGQGGAAGAIAEALSLPRFQAAFQAFAPHATGLNKVSAGLERIMARRASAFAPAGIDLPMPSGGKWQQVMRRIAGQRGWNFADWWELVMRESGGNPGARNPDSGAFGLGQFLGSTAQAYAKYGALSSDPVRQIFAMSKYIADRYGTPTRALAFHDAHNWYAQGGEAVSGGGARGQGRTPGTRAAWIDHLRRKLRRLTNGEPLPGVRRRLDEIDEALLDARKPERKRELREEARALRRQLRGAERRRERRAGVTEARLEGLRGVQETLREIRGERRRSRFVRGALNRDLGPLIEGVTGLPFLGAFEKGGPIHHHGLARVHPRERVLNERETRAFESGGGGTRVDLTFAGELAPLIRLIDHRIDGRAPQVVDRELGRRQRRLSFAPGG